MGKRKHCTVLDTNISEGCKRKFLYAVHGPDGHPIYVGQTNSYRARISAHDAKASACNLKRTIATLRKSHPKWKLADNWRPIECVKDGVPCNLANRYEGFFIEGIENGTNVPGTRQHHAYLLRSNAQDAPNWGDYKHLFDSMKCEVDAAIKNCTQLNFKFSSADSFTINDPDFKESFRDSSILSALVEYVSDSSNDEHFMELQKQYELATRKVHAHEKLFTLNTCLNREITRYEQFPRGVQTVDSIEFVKIWNFAKELMDDYVPANNNQMQTFSHRVAVNTYKEGIRMAGNGDFSTPLDKRHVLFMLKCLRSQIAMRSASGGIEPKSFQSKMAWCTFDTKLEDVSIERKMERLQDCINNDILNDNQRTNIERRLQEGVVRLAAQPLVISTAVDDEAHAY